jgi:glycosyltransferase involved in cell wall biosynthesis
MLPNPSDRNVLLNRVPKEVHLHYIFPQQLTGLKKWIYTNTLIFCPRLFAKQIKFDEKKYDEIICFKDGFYSILFSKSKRPKYLWIHNQPYHRKYISKSLKESFAFLLNRFQIERMNACFDLYDRIFCVSESCKQGYIDIYNNGHAKKEIEVLFNALDLSGIALKAEEPIDLIKPDRMCFVIVIRLSHEKTVDRAILATDRLLKEGYDFEVRILGDGAEFQKLQSLITEHKLNDWITMYGRVSNPFPYMKQADWFLCPSSRESFALTLIEAITLGTPVITTACGGPEDVIDGGRYGVLTENSFEGVYLGMKKVMDDRTLHPYFRSKKQECMDRFDYKKWLNAIDEILDINL